ncbi:MAG: hypothetical protein ACKO3M_11045 [Rubrivivax sp.]
MLLLGGLSLLGLAKLGGAAPAKAPARPA